MDVLAITCPACQHRFDLLSGLQAAEQRDYMQLLTTAKLSSVQMASLLRYLTLFKPAKNSMSFKALTNRTNELLALVKSGRVTYDGNTRGATPADWWATIDYLSTERPASMRLPQKSHRYLTSIVYSQQDQAEAKAEAKQIEDARNQVRDSDDSPPASLYDALDLERLTAPKRSSRDTAGYEKQIGKLRAPHGAGDKDSADQ